MLKIIMIDKQQHQIELHSHLTTIDFNHALQKSAQTNQTWLSWQEPTQEIKLINLSNLFAITTC